jgi:hypothetical protein
MNCITILSCCASLLLTACIVAQHPLPIVGSWVNTNQAAINYPTVTFTSTEAVFTSRGDTVYRFSYTLDQQTHILWLTDRTGKRQAAKIVKATVDSLVFTRLWVVDSPQRFVKKSVP